MKGYVLVLCGLLVAFCACAGRITLNNPDEHELPGGKRLCIYTSTAAGTFTYVTKSKKCAAVKSFDTAVRE
ncbi:hypothetical protein UP00_15970 [Enterobacter asburiae]|uniref:hypothetical protein n=1 Tax=Enterobacter asburiae TaxID=61645 RepID=UPI0005DED8F2|nr:hypothetical protein [Enterobacter asburiae]KJI61045.1 hypothetical protein UP00_15970 [Enterobacter asburiae]